MNHVNFNDGLLYPQDFGCTKDGLTFTQEMPLDVLKSPLFLWDDVESDKLVSRDNDEVMRLVQQNPNVLPFKTMRLFVRPNKMDAAAGSKGFKIWVHHGEDGVLNTRFMRIGLQGDKDCVIAITTTPDGKNMLMSCRRGKLFMGKDTPADVREITKEYSQALFTTLCWFIRESNLPSNFIASVVPDKKGKSVEWTRARTHYVIINKSHPANNKNVEQGTQVSPDAKDIKRMAHTRRAHTRILRSPFFKNKIGQIIRVKATWCGPSEWKQFGSIYRMEKRAA